MMNTKTIIITAAAGLALSAATSRADMEFDFTGVNGSTIQFNGGGTLLAGSSFQFNSANANQWQIQNENGGVNALNLYGGFSSTPITYGAVTTSGSMQTAPVTSAGSFYITDAQGKQLTGTIGWVQTYTIGKGGGGANVDLVVNITDLSYVGVNPDLRAMLNGSQPTIDLSFTFASGGKTLSQLTTGGQFMTQYGGSVSVVPEAGTMFAGAGALGLVVLGVVRSKRSGVIRIG